MSAVAIEQDAWESGAFGPAKFAKRLATYIDNPERIRLLTVREFGVKMSPSVARCAEFRADYVRQRDEFRRLSERDAENDNGEHYQVRGTVKRIRPVSKRVKAVRPGPIARTVIEAVAAHFKLPARIILGKSRKAKFVSARFVAARLLSELRNDNGELRFSRTHIARMMGGRDHSTIIHALHTFNDRGRKYPQMVEAYEALRQAA